MEHMSSPVRFRSDIRARLERSSLSIEDEEDLARPRATKDLLPTMRDLPPATRDLPHLPHSTRDLPQLLPATRALPPPPRPEGPLPVGGKEGEPEPEPTEAPHATGAPRPPAACSPAGSAVQETPPPPLKARCSAPETPPPPLTPRRSIPETPPPPLIPRRSTPETPPPPLKARPSAPETPPPPLKARPSAPETPPPPLKPWRSTRADSDLQPLQLRSQMARQGSLDSPLSPASRPRSPWARLDPYDSPESLKAPELNSMLYEGNVCAQQDQDKEYVGFATLPSQVNRKTVKKGFTFTLMVTGESGLGKSTLINSLFLTDLYKDRKVPNAEERILQTVGIVKHTVGIEEKGVRLRLNIIDTPGFGDAVNNTKSWKEVEDYVDQQFEQYFREESGLNRKNIQDHRVHCCLYFISPSGHGLRPLDVECMRALHQKVNIVPVLAKADSLTPAEVRTKKLKIRQEIEQFGINIYQFPECDSDEDDEFQLQDQILKNSVPFAVIGSNLQVESEGRRFRGRIYPWGLVEVENPEHSDFLLLRNMLVRTHMQDLKDVTRENHYENYRAQCIQSMTRMVVQERRRSLCDQIQHENSADVPLPLAVIASEKERLILEKDQELRRMQEVLERIQEQMLQNHRDGF
ncbi:septin-5-like [Gadus chalcogrammus]|uniref:septin-5-like n=1 Tax=Gadus chalcogrammus TaxID=1042646 RepID=UPI0024C44568|nr:septin-5-like [Gadus chalcogrammus]